MVGGTEIAFPGAEKWGGRSAGKVTIATLLMILFLVSTVYVGMIILPVRTAAFQLDDAVREQVVYAGSRRRRVSNDQILRAIIERATELGLPVTRTEVSIRRARNSIQIRVAYSVPVEMPLGLGFDWAFESDHEGPSF